MATIYSFIFLILGVLLIPVFSELTPTQWSALFFLSMFFFLNCFLQLPVSKIPRVEYIILVYP